MGLLGSSSGGTPGFPSVIPSPTFTGQSKFPDGTVSAPSIADSAGTGGFSFAVTSGIVSISAGGTSPVASWDGNGYRLSSTTVLGWSPGSAHVSAFDTGMYRAAANSIRFGLGTSATTTSRTEINKAVTAFTDAVAKTVFTVTVPNAAHHAVIELEVQGALGAGGAIGAGEAMATNTYKIAIVRTAGVATVATATAAGSAVAVAVAGANTVTATAAVSAMTGAVGATQTFTIDVTITKNAGTSDNHTCLAYAKLVNANATGITIA